MFCFIFYGSNFPYLLIMIFFSPLSPLCGKQFANKLKHFNCILVRGQSVVIQLTANDTIFPNDCKQLLATCITTLKCIKQFLLLHTTLKLWHQYRFLFSINFFLLSYKRLFVYSIWWSKYNFSYMYTFKYVLVC